MSAAAPFLKQIACLRRRADMTRKEFFDHHFCVHGSISDIPENIDEKPHKYVQTHFFDAAFGGRTDGIAGTGNHSWVGRDDMTELYFRDWDHMKSCFSSNYVRTTIAPDGENFNDLETAIPLLVVEKPLSLNHSMLSSEASEGSRTVAVLFLAANSNKSEEELERIISPALVKSLSEHARGEVYGLQVNVGIPADQFDIRAYFGGKNMPEYPVAYKIYMKGSESVAAVRKAQKAFMSRMADVVDSNQTFITFGQEGLVMDVGNKIRVS
ncbi:hypothetical protein BS50DRAFT_664912 [Corynespora cassiicola Philippines]|uniref:EthD domain-containing protein n=1 Tax=Corynespora cassiicola Philippines TaxID=1448308 RepID=A0A2T2NQ97_CORCC|nr:hypothetical protein BS50DRAFT_664912 [Corynespora cassiicola Philippines]